MDTLDQPAAVLPSRLPDARRIPLGRSADPAVTGAVLARVLPKPGVERVAIASFQSAI